MHPTRFQTLIILLATILAVVIPAGCGKESRLNKPAMVTFAGWGNKFEIGLMNDLIAKFERENPDIRVKFVYVPSSNYEPVLLTMMAGGSAPDVFYIAPSMLSDMLSKHVLLQLDTYIAGSKLVKLEDYFPQTIVPYRWDGEHFGKGGLYGICKDWSPDCLVYYNKSLFRKAGIPYPDGSWTRDEFVNIAKKLTVRDANGRTVQFGVYNNSPLEQWVWESGGKFFSSDGTKCQLESPEVLKAAQFAADLSNKWHVAPDYGEAQQGATDVMFETGRAAMCFYGMWYAPQFKESIKDFDWGVTTPPRDVKDVYLSGAMVGYGIYSKTPHPKDAWRFMEFLVGPHGQAAVAGIGFNIPSNRNIAYSPVFTKNSHVSQEVIQTFLKAGEKTRFTQLSPYINLSEFNIYFLSQWDLVMMGQESVPDAMGIIKGQINQAIKDNMSIMGKRGRP